MKLLAAPACLFLLVATATAADKDFTSEDGKYAVTFHAKAKYKLGSIKDNGLVAPFVEAKVGENVQKVMHFDLPEVARGLESGKLFDGGVDGEIKKGDGKLLSSKDFEWGPGKLPARDFVIEVKKRTTLFRMIRNGDRFYVLIAGGVDNFHTSDAAKAFLDSFEITK